MSKIIRKACLLSVLLTPWVVSAGDKPAAATPTAIPWSDIRAKAGADCQGGGLSVTPGETGARLHCAFQRLDGEATPEGLWLTSTATAAVNDRFRMAATGLARRPVSAGAVFEGLEFSLPIASTGNVTVAGGTVRFSRPELTEEYSVSLDGVRQDFIVEQEPLLSPAGELVVNLAVTGAAVEPAADGARLVLEQSGRVLAYSRLQVTDATGRKLPARMEVHPTRTAAAKLAIAVDDTGAVYPVRIDPTFSDANWVQMSGLSCPNSSVFAAVTDGASNLYIGGAFTKVGNLNASHIAKWNGTYWSALGSGMETNVLTLAVSGGTLYAGGIFTTAGGGTVNYIAQWNGTNWSALGSGMNSAVGGLAISGGTLYACGGFSTAGGQPANTIAQWDGTNWSALGSGVNSLTSTVNTLAVSGGILYLGGWFTMVGGVPATNIAQWNGSAWSPLAAGLNTGSQGMGVNALVVSGGTLYAGGDFTTAGGSPASHIAQWNGTSWSPLGPGITGRYVANLALLGGNLCASGDFTNAGGGAANNIAQWNGSSWSSVGSGITGSSTPGLNSLAVSGGKLYAGGRFYSMGFTAAEFIAQWDGTNWSPVGVGVDGPVYAITFSDNALYAGGIFTSAGGLPTGNIAKWDDNNWSKLGAGMGTIGSSAVYSLALSSGTLYAVGTFTSAEGTTASNIAQWDGTNWSTMGSGLGNRGHQADSVLALAVVGGTLYAGGNFQSAGTNTSQNLAEGIVGQLTINYTNSAFGFTNGIFGFDLSGPSGSDVVIQTSADLQTWVPVQTNSLGIGICHFTDPQSATNVPPRYYRAELLLQ